jgi:hypothetical protein
MKFEKFAVLSNGKIEGDGSDNSGSYTWEGSHANGKFEAEKVYPAWTMFYHGTLNKELTKLEGHWGFLKGAA